MNEYDALIESCRACALRFRVNCDRCMFCGKDYYENTCFEQLHRAAADAIEGLQQYEELYREIAGKSQETARSLINSYPRWIPVAERLPENGYYVLAYEDGDILMASYEDGNWVLRDMYEVIDDLKPTHWMPLPSAPTEE